MKLFKILSSVGLILIINGGMVVHAKRVNPDQIQPCIEDFKSKGFKVDEGICAKYLKCRNKNPNDQAQCTPTNLERIPWVW